MDIDTTRESVLNNLPLMREVQNAVRVYLDEVHHGGDTGPGRMSYDRLCRFVILNAPEIIIQSEVGILCKRTAEMRLARVLRHHH